MNAARALARSGENSQALEQLGVAADFGVRFDPADDASSSLRDDARFRRLESRMRAGMMAFEKAMVAGCLALQITTLVAVEA